MCYTRTQNVDLRTGVPIGKNKLSEMMKTMAQEGKLDKPGTNHSLRVCGVTKMFVANIPEKVMMERSGHHSIDGLWHYERTSALQELQVCNALQSRKEDTEKVPVVAQPAAGPLSLPGFNGCTFNNCTFQVATPVQANFQQPMQATLQADVDYLSKINIQEFFQ